MTKGQKCIVLIILITPIILGMILMSMKSSSDGLHISSISSKRVGLLEINDVINSSDDYVRQLRALREDNTVAGILLRIDSPGGAVAPSQEIFKEVMELRRLNKPVVVSMGNLAASGGYYVACPAFKIFANPGTITGSIGVIISFPHYYKLLNKIGVDFQVLKSGKLKDVGNPNREMTPHEKAFLQNMLDDIHSQFIEDVSEARDIDIDSLTRIADGRIFTGRQAINAGLVDTLGGFEDAVSYLKKLVGAPEKSPIVEKKIKDGFFKRLLYEEFFDKIPFLKQALSPAGSYFLYDISIR